MTAIFCQQIEEASPLSSGFHCCCWLVVILTAILLKVICLYSAASVMLSLVFYSFILMCLGGEFFFFISCLGFTEHPESLIEFFNHSGKFLVFLSSNFASAHISPLLLELQLDTFSLYPLWFLTLFHIFSLSL